MTFKPPFSPPTEAEALSVTLNKMGYMVREFDPVRQAFVEYAGSIKIPVLEIGAAYGIAALAVLKKGASIIVNDLDVRHLEYLRQVASVDQDRLQLVPGHFPNEINFPPNSLPAILISRVLHFFPGALIEKSLKALHKWLQPGGKVFIVTESPYLGIYRDFIPLYEKRKQEGWEWPGEIEDVSFYTWRAKDYPKFVHPLDRDVLTRALLKFNFFIEKSAYFTLQSYPSDVKLDGRETVGIIARKEI